MEDIVRDAIPAAGGGRKNIHPFPARMAPEIALDKIDLLTRAGALVLDPMCGSGTVVRLAAERGRIAIGADLDPLAVLMTRTACRPDLAKNLVPRAIDVVRKARLLSGKLPDWIASDEESSKFVRYWFAPQQAEDLSRLARVLFNRSRKDDPLRIALSRMIVTKEKAASLARDTSHSRPHRVADVSDYDVLREFVRSAKRLSTVIEESSFRHRPRVRRADARALHFINPSSIDLALTSPPYLNAIDYLRGHRMALVWMGWTVSELRRVRGMSVGVERAIADVDSEVREVAEAAVPRIAELPRRWQGMVLRFALDMHKLTRSLARATKRHGHLVMVVADSQLRGVPVSNARICAGAASRNGFSLVDEAERLLPARHRYLPPPTATTGTLASRMKHEIIFTFKRV